MSEGLFPSSFYTQMLSNLGKSSTPATQREEGLREKERRWPLSLCYLLGDWGATHLLLLCIIGSSRDHLDFAMFPTTAKNMVFSNILVP
jgi:hypothetical protein